ncbi:hypothetical protein [Spirosoma pollinicola]|uniref:Uncharacterized protein n=1 Tax=Spirosoma pollinicola TaxID=2057025 RepID=A0A2K8YWV4_9BACT|nr:hypothetical protein [Spirosoma pollinicola]AUD02111.1 hypothetical protein CWM47_09940 [Spirosoma pollinicola]
MDAEVAKRVVYQLAFNWVQLNLPTDRLTYTDYINAIGGLQVITDDPTRTKAIFSAILDQANELGYSSEWVEVELKFEAQAEAVGDRAKWLRLDVAAREASDESLDLYNLRVSRFISKPGSNGKESND